MTNNLPASPRLLAEMAPQGSFIAGYSSCLFMMNQQETQDNLARHLWRLGILQKQGNTEDEYNAFLKKLGESYLLYGEAAKALREHMEQYGLFFGPPVPAKNKKGTVAPPAFRQVPDWLRQEWAKQREAKEKRDKEKKKRAGKKAKRKASKSQKKKKRKR